MKRQPFIWVVSIDEREMRPLYPYYTSETKAKQAIRLTFPEAVEMPPDGIHSGLPLIG